MEKSPRLRTFGTKSPEQPNILVLRVSCDQSLLLIQKTSTPFFPPIQNTWGDTISSIDRISFTSSQKYKLSIHYFLSSPGKPLPFSYLPRAVSLPDGGKKLKSLFQKKVFYSNLCKNDLLSTYCLLEGEVVKPKHINVSWMYKQFIL